MTEIEVFLTLTRLACKLRTLCLPWNPSTHKCKRRRRAPEAQTLNMSRRLSAFATHVPLLATSAAAGGNGGDTSNHDMQPAVLHIRPRKLTVAENGKVYVVGSQQGSPRCVVHRQVSTAVASSLPLYAYVTVHDSS